MAFVGLFIILGAIAFAGCTGRGPANKDSTDTKQSTETKNYPVFTLAWSEYPSWSVFGVASDRRLINGERGKVGLLEERWGVDIELQLLSYEKCMSSYGSKESDAACLTNMDTLNPSLTRKSVAIMPTSTSDGADALIVDGIADLDELQKHEVHGLSQSVSDYAFYRLLEENKKDPKNYKWKDLDPALAAKEMAAKKVKAIMVWNPFVLQTVRDRPETKIMFDSSKIPEEIIDMVVVGDDVLSREKGTEFACCVAQAYYEFNVELNTKDKDKREKLLIDLGKRFSSLDAKDMAECCVKTKFYSTPEKALELFDGPRTDTFKKRMDAIVRSYKERGIVTAAPKLGFGPRDKNAEAQLIFDPSYIKMVKDKIKKD